MQPVAAVYLDEVFLSLQGEAGEVGRPQLFLRLGGCPLRCRYCDTPRSWLRQPVYRRHDAAGCLERPNPVSAPDLSAELASVTASHGVEGAPLALAVTGGEPLEQVDFLESWLPSWPAPVLLETAGIWPERLARVLAHVDIVSLDWKLASTVRAGAERVAALECAAMLHDSGKPGWVKLVVAEDTPEAELEQALERLSARAPGVRAYLQPATRFGAGPGPPPAQRLLHWALRFRSLPLDLRVQPQMHPLLGLR